MDEPSAPDDPGLPPDHPAHPAKRRHVPCVVQGCVVLLLVGMLASIWLPSINRVGARGVQTRALAYAKSIGFALKLFASDHDGRYPTAGVPVEMTTAPTDANAAFACLFPSYTNSETIFGNKLSAYQTRPPDNVIDNPATFPRVKTLEPGENVWGYVMGLTDESEPNKPLVVEGTDGTGHYRTDSRERGGLWGGTKAVVIRLDNSGSLETLQGPANARFMPTKVDGQTQNLLDPALLGAGVRLLDPAVAP